jgi:3',5'-cyclic AMP phosphodiesterase CpdA
MPTVKLAVTGDLHLPITSSTVMATLAREAAVFAPDALIVAGDMAESLPYLRRCLDILTSLVTCPVWVLPGNHDLWCREAASRRLWEELLPRAVAAAGCHWLEGTAFVLNGVAVAGTIAWYDYSAADPSIQVSTEAFARNKGHFNADARFLDWPWSDPEFAALAAGPFLATLDRLEADPSVRQTVVVTHMPLLECQMCRNSRDQGWAFSNAYFGNLTLGWQVLERKKVTHVLSGHTHVGREASLQRKDGRAIEARVLASDYRHPAWMGITLDGSS